ncbi:MAG: hypothetical protein JKY65_14940, partial [Planctomycetes bacterium]|nr:hypothetical protein [Planctomycetota bacterium]
GELAAGALELAALAGDEAARLVHPGTFTAPPEQGRGLVAWLEALATHDPRTLRRAVLGATRPAIRGLPSGTPRRGWESRAWLALSRVTLCPCEVHVAWLLRPERQTSLGNWGRVLDLRRSLGGIQAVRAMFEESAARLSWTRVVEAACADLRALALGEDPLRAGWKSPVSWLSREDLVERLSGTPGDDPDGVLDPEFPYAGSESGVEALADRALNFEPPDADPPELNAWAARHWQALGRQAEFDAFSV